MAKDDDPQDPKGTAGGGEGLSQHPYVERIRPDPSAPAQPVRVLAGLLGDSDRPGYRRLYFSKDLTYYAEFKDEDVVYTEPVPPDQPPFVGMDATRAAIRRDAAIAFTRSRTPRPVDEFDLDIRLGRAGRRAPMVGLEPETWEAECPGPSWFAPCWTDITCACETVDITICRGRTCIDICDTMFRTCDTCLTQCDQPTCVGTQCGQQTCQTCQTQCNQATCVTCKTCITCQTCQTQCNQATCVTCQTCQTQCNQDTCATCETMCGQPTCGAGRTCVTCDTCNPHVFTCGPNPQCRF